MCAPCACCVSLQVLRSIPRDYIVEVYTEASFGIRHHSNGSYHRISSSKYVQDLHHNIGRHMVLLADQDLAWTFSQMSTADIFVHSMSTLSIAAGIFNTQVWKWAASRSHHPSVGSCGLRKYLRLSCCQWTPPIQ